MLRVWLLALLMAGALGACGSSDVAVVDEPAARTVEAAVDAVVDEVVDDEPAPTRGLIAADPVVWAMPGVRLAIPVQYLRAGAPPRRVRVRTEVGERVRGDVVWIGVESRLESAVSVSGSWLPDPGRWVSGPPRDVRRGAGFGRHFVLVDLPASAVGQDVFLGDNRVRLTWLAGADGADERVLSAPFDDERRRNRALAALARPERLSPVRRWRYLLTTGRLASAPTSPPAESAAGVTSAGGRFEDTAIETLARQAEARWRAALVGLHALDAELAQRVRRRLAATVRFERSPGLSDEVTIAPAWPVDQSSLDTLLSDLLDPSVDPAVALGVRRERAEQWLDEQADGMGWVIADAAGVDALNSRPFVGAVVANLAGGDAVASVSVAGSGDAPVLAPAPPERAVVLSVAGGASGGGASGVGASGVGAGSVSLSVGDWRATRAVQGALRVSPPGLSTGPFFGDWTLETSVVGDARSLRAPAASATATVLYRDTDDPFGASVDEGWSLFIECEAPEGVSGDDSVRVWFGPMGAATGSVRVSADGRVRPGVEGSQVVWNPADVVVERGEREWSVRLPVAPVLVGRDGLLLLGVERRSGAARQAWPRPMLPWQTEPGRVGADLRGWSGAG